MGWVLSGEMGRTSRCRSRSAEEKAASFHTQKASVEWTLRRRRPHARGDVLCAEPGRSHSRPDRPGPVHEGINRTMNMYVDEKSDSVIVPTKPSNKEGVSAAETMEGRMLPEGNSDQETAVRTQSRVAASNYLMAVRRAGQQDVDTKCLMRPHLVQ